MARRVAVPRTWLAVAPPPRSLYGLRKPNDSNESGDAEAQCQR